MKNDILKNEYDFIFSLGAACSCTSILRQIGVQFESYPLDWLYGGGLEIRTELLINNFKDFINLEDLKPVGQRLNPEPCDIYANMKNKIVFNHDFPLNGNLEKDYFEIKEKYDRIITRLFKNIENSNKICIVYIETPNTKPEKSHKLKRIIKSCYKKIANRWSDKQIDMVYLRSKKPLLFNKKMEYLGKNVMLGSFNYRNPDLSTEPYVVDNELLCEIFKTIKLSKRVIKIQEKKNVY